jgi:hypothetical protein
MKHTKEIGMKSRIEIISGPDSHDRYVYWKKWNVENPAYCLTCGECATRKCACYNNKKERGQIFHAKLPG